MAKVKNDIARAPQFPWDVRTIVRPRELERPGKVKRKGDPKNPALASVALMEWIGHAHNADELRLPLPPMPDGHDADLAALTDRRALGEFVGQVDDAVDEVMERALTGLRAMPDRLERLKALLGRERQMRLLVRQVHADIEEIERKRREETQDEGY